jgi:3-phenylpropionate/trans-cinnamate dioxygenase ferredoxin reductase subunit
MSGSGHVVVIGAGLAGVRTAERLREGGYAGAITLVGEEAEPPYDRPPLSKQVLRGEREVVRLREPDSYADLGLELRLGVRAASLDVEARRVELDDGTTIDYETLVVATGATPRVLPGDLQQGVHVLRSAEDCRRLRASAADARQAVVVGGGFIGCEVAASLRLMQLDVTVVELASAPLVGVLGEQLSADVVRLHEGNGVTMRCGVGVDALEGDERVTGVRLLDGSVVAADLVVVGLGVTPAVEWLADSGLVIDNGLTCDESGRTSAPGVFAVGDVANWHDPRAGRARRYEHWTSAVDQAAVVAQTILTGVAESLLPVPYFWSDQYKVKIQSLGVPSGAADEIVVLELSDIKRLALYGTDGVLTGAVSFSSPAAVMKMRPLLTDRTPFAEAVDTARAS